MQVSIVPVCLALIIKIVVDRVIVLVAAEAAFNRLFIAGLLTQRMRRINDTLQHSGLLFVLPLHNRQNQAVARLIFGVICGSSL